jgi:RsiW-degrading membrane proteinase PrsW (M82 family)
LSDDILFLLILILVAFLPSVIYLVWIRDTERYSREPYKMLLRAFLYGAVLSVIIAVILEIILVALFSENIERVYEFLGEHPSIPLLILVCVIAPFAEEATKALGVFRARRKGLIRELESGIIYGAAVGLGFAATENLLYESTAYLTDGLSAFIATAVVRSLSSALLHATSTSVVGLGIARNTLEGRSWIPYYLIGVAMHSAFNFAASFGTIYQDELGDAAYLVGLVVAFSIAIFGVKVMRAKIRHLDRRHRGRSHR